MKSILLISSSSESSTSSSNLQTFNNLSLLAESCSVEENNSEIFKETSVKETLSDESLTEKTLVESVLLTKNNIKKQIINNKLSLKSDPKLKRSDRDLYSDSKCEKRKHKTASEVNSENLENRPLIEKKNITLNESDNPFSKGEKLLPSVITQANSTSSTATKLINLRKKNGTTLIFQSKNYSQQSQQQSTSENHCEYQELEIESFKKRQSLHWPKSAISSHSKSYKSRHYSWHDPHYFSQHSIKEEFENSVSFACILYMCAPLSA